MRTPSTPSRAVRSTMTIASAPGGIGAPVMIRIDSPGADGALGVRPAGSSPTTRNRTGVSDAAPTVSAAAQLRTVHRGVGEGWHRFGGRHVLGRARG